MLKRNSTEIILVMALVFAFHDGATLHAEDIALSPTEFKEALLTSSPIGGTQVVGVIVLKAGLNPNPSRLFVRVPPSPSNDLRVRITSRDGLYEASATFQLTPGAHGKTVRLVMPTSYTPKWLAYKALDLGVLAETRDLNGSPSEVIPVGWDPSGGVQTVALINKGAATSTRISRRDTPIKSVGCEPIDDANSVAFDMRCDLSELLTEQTSRLSLVRKSFDRVLPSQYFSVARP
jgi:hypothetical protein